MAKHRLIECPHCGQAVKLTVENGELVASKMPGGAPAPKPKKTDDDVFEFFDMEDGDDDSKD